MRIWHKALLPYLPDAQFKGQLRELIAILHNLKSKGTPNHLLVNYVLNYPKIDLYQYFIDYSKLYEERYGKSIFSKYWEEFHDYVFDENMSDGFHPHQTPFRGYHDKEYLRICMANLFEKHIAIGKNAITREEWQRLLDGYKAITGEEYYV